MPTLDSGSLSSDSEKTLIVQDWGLIDYNQALEKQLELVNEVAEKNIPGYLVFCTHPPVVTKGRSTKENDIFAWQGQVVEVSRGGRATYHGPSQIVIYPILNLKFARHGRKEKEIVGYLRALEDAIVLTLKEYGIEAQGRSLQKKDNTEADETGVWVGNQKIASLGVAVKKWVTYHGAAINILKDPQAFLGINPCGFQSSVAVSLEEICKKPVSYDEVKSQILKNLIAQL